jgi:host factor-I protein
MPSENVHRLQDTFLEHLQRKRTPVTVFLINGVKLQGIVSGFDAFCVMIERDGQQQIVYKHAISTTLPAYSVDLRDTSEAVEPIKRPRGTVIVERRGRPRFAK